MVSHANNPWKYLHILRPDLKRKYKPRQTLNREAKVTANSIAEGFARITNDESIQCEDHTREYQDLRKRLEGAATTFEFRPISKQEVFAAAKRANSTSTAGMDQIPPTVWARLVEDATILSYLTRQFNAIFRSGIYPESFKEYDPSSAQGLRWIPTY